MPRSRPITFVLVATLAVGLAACSSSSRSAGPSAPKSQGTTTTATSSGAPQLETKQPGDIPDNQAYVPFKAPKFTVSVPEGWTQQAQGAGTHFTDKYNSITIQSVPAAKAPTVASAQATELPTIRSQAVAFVAGAVKAVSRTSGPGVLITYKAQSPVNPVTGKVVIQAVERYEFWKNGNEVVLTLAAPVGADNVDPWRKVTDSFAWTGK
ncbi:MAG: hypothetical protein JWP39_2457 [Jatrophihabitans sp.]|jgi:hypothetical protein|nr:hypothetical protein [Jatrophihabitans sp.]